METRKTSASRRTSTRTTSPDAGPLSRATASSATTTMNSTPTASQGSTSTVSHSTRRTRTATTFGSPALLTRCRSPRYVALSAARTSSSGPYPPQRVAALAPTPSSSTTTLSTSTPATTRPSVRRPCSSTPAPQASASASGRPSPAQRSTSLPTTSLTRGHGSVASTRVATNTSGPSLTVAVRLSIPFA